MSNFAKLRERYRNDPIFHTFVNNQVYVMEMLALTPSEVRDAAMLASIIFEERHPRPIEFGGIKYVYHVVPADYAPPAAPENVPPMSKLSIFSKEFWRRLREKKNRADKS